MKKVRITALCLALCLCAALLSACGSKSKVKDDVSVETVAQAVDTAIGNAGDLVAVDENYISGSMKMDVSDYGEYIVKINAYGANVDEYGIFHGKDADQTAEIAKAVEAYLKMRVDTWMDEYMPEEKPKMEAATYKTVGNYVVYAVLEDASQQAAFDAVESALGAK